MLKNWLLLAALVGWCAVATLPATVGLLLLVGMESFSIPACLLVAVVASTSSVGPVAQIVLRDLGAGTVLGPQAGAVWGLRSFEANALLRMEHAADRRRDRLASARERVTGTPRSAVEPVWGTLRQRDVYGSFFVVGTGLLCIEDGRVAFVGSRWFGWRASFMGYVDSPRGTSLRDAFHLQGDERVVLRITGWHSTMSLMGDDVLFEPAGPGLLRFLSLVFELGDR